MKAAIFWVLEALVKIRRRGKVLVIPVADHHGDVCLVNGKVYCAVFRRSIIPEAGQTIGFVYAARDLNCWPSTRWVKHGAGGVYGAKRADLSWWADCRKVCRKIMFYEYDKDFKFIKRHVIKSGWLTPEPLPLHEGTGGCVLW